MDEKSYINGDITYRLAIKDRLKNLGLGLRYIENYISSEQNVVIFEIYPIELDFINIAYFEMTIDSSDKSRERSKYTYEIGIEGLKYFNEKRCGCKRALLDILYDIACDAIDIFEEGNED